MIKKIILTLMFCCFTFACGKKGDPVYKESKKEELKTIIKNKV